MPRLMHSTFVIVASWLLSVSAMSDALVFEWRAPEIQKPVTKISARIAAADEVLQRIVGGQQSKSLVCYALAGREDLLQIQETKPGVWLVTCPDTDGVLDAVAAMKRLHAEYGPPRILVEAIRPGHPIDREIASEIAGQLKNDGLQLVDGRANRDEQRKQSDQAVQRGLSKQDGLTSLDQARNEFDFIIRITGSQESSSETVYQIPMHRCTYTVSPCLIRRANQSPIVTFSKIGQAQERDIERAEQKARASAIDEVNPALTAAIAAEWLAMGLGRTETILEIDGDIALATDEVAQRLHLESAQFLEKRNGLAQIVRVPKLNKDFSASEIGTIEFQRPGYIRIVQSGALVTQWIIAAAIGVVLLAAGALWIARSRRGSRDVSGGISR